jgi:hypothetical protein
MDFILADQLEIPVRNTFGLRYFVDFLLSSCTFCILDIRQFVYSAQPFMMAYNECLRIRSLANEPYQRYSGLLELHNILTNLIHVIHRNRAHLDGNLA